MVFAKRIDFLFLSFVQRKAIVYNGLLCSRSTYEIRANRKLVPLYGETNIIRVLENSGPCMKVGKSCCNGYKMETGQKTGKATKDGQGWQRLRAVRNGDRLDRKRWNRFGSCGNGPKRTPQETKKKKIKLYPGECSRFLREYSRPRTSGN